MVIIGSEAIKYYYPDFKRIPKDIDIIIETEDEEIVLDGVYDRVERLINPVILKHHQLGTQYLRPDNLCTLKASHLCWNINWDKHMFDLQFLLKKGCKINKEQWLELYNYWNTYHEKNKRSDLKMSKNDFFDNQINYNTTEHDDLHKILNPIPTYTKVLKDNCEVELDESKFHELSHEDKILFVNEEVMTMAFERMNYLPYMEAYSKMLRKFIISHAPIWSVIFILENYIELHKPKFNFIKTIEYGLHKIK